MENEKQTNMKEYQTKATHFYSNSIVNTLVDLEHRAVSKEQLKACIEIVEGHRP